MKKTKCYSKISKAQIEVWEMKKKLYEKVKHLPLDEALYQILEDSRKTTE